MGVVAIKKYTLSYSKLINAIGRLLKNAYTPFLVNGPKAPLLDAWLQKHHFITKQVLSQSSPLLRKYGDNFVKVLTLKEIW